MSAPSVPLMDHCHNIAKVRYRCTFLIEVDYILSYMYIQHRLHLKMWFMKKLVLPGSPFPGTVPWDYYYVTAASKGGNVSVTVSGSETEVNVTGLQPGTEYTLTVVSVSDHGQIRSPRVSLVVTTLARPGTHTCI